MSAQGGSLVWPRFAVGLGGTASVAANIAHAWVSAAPGGPRPGAVMASALWPVLVIVAVELLTAGVWPSGWWWAWVRVGGTGLVAVVAGVASYSHMSELLTHYGESALVARLGPIAVDGLMVMATATLIAGRHRAAAQESVTADVVSVLNTTSAAVLEADPVVAGESGVVESADAVAVSQVPVRPGVRSLGDLRYELAQAISAGRLSADPSGEAIRRELACSPVRARILRDERLARRDSYRVLGSDDSAPPAPVSTSVSDVSPERVSGQLPGQLVMGEVEGVSAQGLIAV